MPLIKPFRGIRPDGEFASRVIVHPSDAGDTKRAALAASANPYSFLHISHAELDMSFNDAVYEKKVKTKTHETLNRFFDEKILIRDARDSFYIYRMHREGMVQTGLIAGVRSMDYSENIIKKHELVRHEKLEAQLRLIDRIGGNIEPVLLAYDSARHKTTLPEEWADSHEPTYTFMEENMSKHEFWVVPDPEFIDACVSFFQEVPALYICDGHHRAAAAAAYAKEHSSPESQFFMALLLPSEQMNILDYNRAVHDICNMDKDQFLAKLGEAGFRIEPTGDAPIKPEVIGEFAMIIDNTWYRMVYAGDRDSGDPIASLDVSLLQDLILGPILGIDNPQSDKRLSFIKGTHGLQALKEATETTSEVAFGLYPVTMMQIMRVADAGMTMPPKSTCFVPKPMSGLLIFRVKE